MTLTTSPTARRSLLTGLLAGALALSACGGGQRQGAELFEIAEGPAADALGVWMGGDDDEARARAEALDLEQADADALFTAAEIAYWSGDVERAFVAHGDLLRRFPAHPFARYAAARLYSMRDEVMDYEVRTEPLLEGLDYAALAPLTRLYVSMAGQTVAYRLWDRSDIAAPFEADRFGFPAAWTTTPMLSPWRLLDIDTPMPPEQQPSLAASYRSPLAAVDDPINVEPTEPYLSGGISLHPGFASDGVYYMESFATLPADQAGQGARDYWLYGNFVGAARVWIDGEEVFVRDEEDYGTGKRLRRIRLSPGTHRVLVKLAFDAGYRDWFDLTFVPDGAHRVDEAALRFRYACREDRPLPDCFEGSADGSIELLGEAKTPAALDPATRTAQHLDEASDEALYVAMLSAFFNADAATFDAASEALAERRPDFAPGHALFAAQVQTLWELPSRRRDALALQALRRAHRLDPESVRYLSDLGAWLRERDGEREAQEILEAARDGAIDEEGRVRAIAPLNDWASWLTSKGWDVEAEQAWQAALDADPANCKAAAKLQSLLAARMAYPEPEEITPAAGRCPELRESWLANQPDRGEERLELSARRAARYPLRASVALDHIRALQRDGGWVDVEALLEAALERFPDDESLWAALADVYLAQDGWIAASEVLSRAIDRNGPSGFLLWRRALLEGQVRFGHVDGRDAAALALERSRALKAEGGELSASLSDDDAYYVLDYTHRSYFPDGASLTLTHTVVRVMTKSAIDRYAEQSIPGSAQLLVARTIKQDGSTRVPEDTSGKTTLSMPGLAEGDFVEIAYVQYEGPSTPKTHLEGIRFYYRMEDISTLHSEFETTGPPIARLGGGASGVMRVNDPPEVKRSINAVEGDYLQVVAHDNPRPRDEPHAVPADEYLPWTQAWSDGWAIGDFEADRRDTAEEIRDSLQLSADAREQIQGWIDAVQADPKADPAAFAEELFYVVAAYLPDPSPGSFGTEVSHAIATRQGDALMLLLAAYELAGVPAEIVMVRSKYQPPTPRPVGEFALYTEPLLRVRAGEAEVWSTVPGPEAMFGAVPDDLVGQRAVCVSCEEADAELVVPEAGHRSNGQALDVRGEVAADGTLQGRMSYRFDGVSAASVRRGLRSRTDETSRVKLMDALLNGVISASTVTDWRIEAEDAPDEALRITIDFTRPDFARLVGEAGSGLRQIETRLFREPVASLYASLAERTVPILIANDRDNTYHLELDLGAFDTASLGSEAGQRRMTSRFGDYTRTTTLEGGRLTIDSRLDLPIQRIPVSAYREFQGWATGVEQSANLLVVLGQ